MLSHHRYKYGIQFLALHSSILKIKAEFFDETLISVYKSARYHNPQNNNLSKIISVPVTYLNLRYYDREWDEMDM
jgi:hypothetical protein